MATIKDRYTAATEYVRRAITAVESKPLAYAIDPVTGLIEWYAGRTKTEPARNELMRIEARWMRATSEIERARIARDAELLADRVQETLPGAPQDRKRTNLYAGEHQTSTPATSYYGEVADEAVELGSYAKGFAGSALDGIASVGKWLLLGGGVLLALKTVEYLRERERKRPAPPERQLQSALEGAANSREREP